MSLDIGAGAAGELSPVKRALLEIRDLRARLAAAEAARHEPVAVVGIGCRFPGGVDGPDTLWRLLCNGVDAIGEVPPERWDLEAYFDPDPTVPGKMSTRWGGFLDTVEGFDAPFFSISPREAMQMDPQHRMVLEVAWEALENAGIAPDRLVGSATGVFLGISSTDYAQLVLASPPEAADGYLAPGIVHSAAAGRLSYFLGLEGPALSVDTACSSSLMAVHLALQSLRTGECRMAIAGGVNVVLTPQLLVGFSKAGMMASDGRCKAFDARADGFVRAEGCGLVVLKRLSDARADGDDLWAVIRGSAANQDGRSSGMTAPNGPAQEAVIAAALADAGVEPWQVGYVEAHGTGTALGDPIEVQALAAVLGQDRAPEQPVLLGSLKTNLGHLEAAAGVAGLMKAALALRHGQVPPGIHFREPNPFIPWSEIPVSVATAQAPYPTIAGRRVAGVSSFGFSGTNVHVVLEAAPLEVSGSPAAEAPAAVPQRPVQVLKLSAREPAALDGLASRWLHTLETSTDSFSDLCFTANRGRADLPERMVVIAASAAEARGKLEAHARGEEPIGVFRGRALDPARTAVTFLFTGHGAQYAGMGRQLFETEPTFRAALEECDALLRPHLARPLLEVLYPAPGEEGESLLLNGMTYSQPALFAFEYALARLWISWGVQPSQVLGHSVGEYAAAVVAGVFSLEDGLKLVAARGRLMDSLSRRGAMLAIFAPEAQVAALVAPYRSEVSLAAINGPAEVVVSGESSALGAIAGELTLREIEFRRLAVAQAGHSHLLDPILDEFEAVAATVGYGAPQIELISCTTGQPVSAAEISDPRYWRRHLREPVRFAAGIDTLHREGCEIFLEIGPHTNLVGMGSRCLPEGAALWLASLRRDWDAWQHILESLAALYVRGVAIDWGGFERDCRDAPGAPRRRVPLPTYPWQHRRYWLEQVVPANGRAAMKAEPAAAWEEIYAAGRRQEAQGPLDLALPTFPTRWGALDRLTTALVASTLRTLGAFRTPGERRSADDLVAEAGILPRYGRLVDRWLRRLARAGLLREEDDGFVASEPVGDAGLEEAWRQVETAIADWPFMIEYLRRCGQLLPGVLTGRANPLETIFPEGTFDTADHLYRDFILPRYYNAIAGAVVSAQIASRGDAPLRVLEVGAGTGGTTATLLPLVERAGGSYLFTDVSDLFLARASESFAAYDCLSFGLLDVDRDPLEQGYAPGSFDLIVAANVLHAVHDVPLALARVRSLLAPGGLLLPIEVTTYLDWFEVSTALLEGWDRQADELRPEHPMLSVAAWERAMRETGFEQVAAFPAPGSPAEIMAQHVLLAQAPLVSAGLEEAPAGGLEARRNGAPAQRSRTAGEREPAAAFAERLTAIPPHEREDLLVEYVRGHIAALLRLESPRRVERRSRLMELGLDSLMAVELRSRLSKGLPLSEPLPATLIFDHPTVDAIVGLLSRLLEAPAAAPAAEAVVPVPAIVGAPTDEELDALTDEEVEARLLARLAMIEEEVQ